MPLPTSFVGSVSEAIEHTVDARWLMAYAAGLGDTDECYLDTNADIACHPVFPVCLEWPAILAGRAANAGSELTPDEAARAVHAGHDLHWHKPIGAGTTLSTTSTIVGIRASRAGAISLMRLDTVDRAGSLICQTWQTSVYRGVDIVGEARAIEEAPSTIAFRDNTEASTQTLPVSASAAHVYTECARIWNPIHTDRAFAQTAGLPDIILHGTATLAMAVSEMIRRYAGGEPRRVSRLGGEFRGQVPMPCELVVRSYAPTDNTVSFDVSIGSDGPQAIRNGFIEMSQARS